MKSKDSRFVANLPSREYHEWDGHHSSSRLKLVGTSPLQYRYPPEKKDTDDFKLGRAFEDMIFEPLKFRDKYVVYNTEHRPQKEMTMASKMNKQWKVDLFEQAEVDGNTIISQEMFDTIFAMSEKILDDPNVFTLFQEGWIEPSIYWVDRKTKMKCKTRPDFLRKNLITIDIKTTIDASPDAFSRTIAKLGYDVQAAMQYDGVMSHFKKVPPYHIFLAVEKKPPYNYGIYRLSVDAIDRGRNKYQEYLRIIKECEQNEKWPSYSHWSKNKSGIITLDTPSYTHNAIYRN